jgi:hypothetical protein
MIECYELEKNDVSRVLFRGVITKIVEKNSCKFNKVRSSKSGGYFVIEKSADEIVTALDNLIAGLETTIFESKKKKKKRWFKKRYLLLLFLGISIGVLAYYAYESKSKKTDSKKAASKKSKKSSVDDSAEDNVEESVDEKTGVAVKKGPKLSDPREDEDEYLNFACQRSGTKIGKKYSKLRVGGDPRRKVNIFIHRKGGGGWGNYGKSKYF